jgi:hypothetical protein
MAFGMLWAPVDLSLRGVVGIVSGARFRYAL